MTGLWRHRGGGVEPPLRLTAISYDQETGALTIPHISEERAPESALAGYLAEARRILAVESEDGSDSDLTPQVGPEFERLRWFELRRASL